MKWRSLLFFLYLSPCFALQEESAPKPVPYDIDLYRRDVEVVFVNAEFLFWRIEEGSLDYAFQMQKPATGAPASYEQGKEKRAQFDFDPGFRVAVGYFNAPKFWEAFLQYTWLYDEGNNTVNKPVTTDLFLNATWPQIFTNPIQKATSHIGFHYNLLELLASRVFNPNPHLRLRLFGGVPSTYQTQHWQIQYFDGVGNETKVKNNWRFRGLGLKLGLALDWYWGANFYITSIFSTACLFGDYKNLAYQKSNFNPTGSDNPDVPVRNALRKDLRLAYNIQYLFGLSYQKNFPCSRLEVFAGYELGAWFNLQEIYRSLPLILPTGRSASIASPEPWQSTGLLALHGLTTRVTVNF